MRIRFSDDQRLLRDAVRELLDKECAPPRLREAASPDARASRDRWRALAQMGVVGMTAPEHAGGLGLDFTSLVLVLEEAGRAALPEPLLETTALAVPMLSTIARPSEWVARAAAGDAILTVGHSDAPIVAAGSADAVTLRFGDELHCFDAAQIVAAPVWSLDPLRRLYTVTADPSADTLIASGEQVARLGAQMFERAALGTAAMLLGVASRAIELGAAYAVERHQFGRPIGSFQAVKHRLADALVALEFARPVVYAAAQTLSAKPNECALDVSMAKAFASDAATNACKAALQVHGAIGYTEEHDLHLWLKRGLALAPSYGDAAWHRERVARLVLPRA